MGFDASNFAIQRVPNLGHLQLVNTHTTIFCIESCRFAYICHLTAIMPNEDVIPESRSVTAARWLIRVQGLYYVRMERQRFTTSRIIRRPTVRDAAKLYRVGHSQVAVHNKALLKTGQPGFSQRTVGRPTTLTEGEDKALCAYATWLYESGSFAARDLIEDAANRMRARRLPPASPVCKNWWSRWKKDHPWFSSSHFKPVEAKRLSAEQRIQYIEQFYDKLEYGVETYNIILTSCWNADEMGARLAKLEGRGLEILQVKTEKKRDVVVLTLILLILRQLTIWFLVARSPRPR